MNVFLEAKRKQPILQQHLWISRSAVQNCELEGHRLI